ncbi:MAG: DUF423 domain-containing protein [Salibacteraceae bacterium]
MSTSSQVNNIKLLRFASFSMVIAVVLGAMGAHWLKTVLSAENLLSFNTGIRYHVFHSLGLFVVILLKSNGFQFSKWVSNLFIIGMILFSGSIYCLSTIPAHGFDFVRVLGPITPIGGLCLIAGWAVLGTTISKK